MKFVGQLESPFVRRVAVSMTVLGLPFERDPLSVFGGSPEAARAALRRLRCEAG